MSFAAVYAPIRTVSELNQREHWARRSKRRNGQRRDIRLFLNCNYKPAVPVVVTLTRIAPRKLDEGDNLASSFKAIRDEIADWLGVDDGDGESVVWRYAQRQGEPKEYAVMVEARTALKACGVEI